SRCGRAARACHDRHLGDRRRSHPRVRALQPGRRAGDRRGRTRGGGAPTAAGALAAAAPDLMQSLGLGKITALQVMFYAYAALGVVSAALYAQLPHAELKAAPPAAALGPSRGIVYKLSALFSLDSFAGGFAVPSLIALWLFERFDLSLTAASLFFFWSNVLTAF